MPFAPHSFLQPMYVPKTKNLITLAESLPEETVVTWKNTATKIEHHQAARVIGTGTFGFGATIVEGEDFIAENITFENFALEVVAIRVTDKSFFLRKLLAAIGGILAAEAPRKLALEMTIVTLAFFIVVHIWSECIGLLAQA
ncbi:Pectinesterase 31 [Orobanche minor]